MSDNTTLFNMEINGVKLTRAEMADIHDYYAACCTAGEILDKYGNKIKDEDEALSLAYRAREVMDTYDMSEYDAIQHVMSERK